jgi:hypothetical protein
MGEWVQVLDFLAGCPRPWYGDDVVNEALYCGSVGSPGGFEP